MTGSELAALRALAQKVTPGPWTNEGEQQEDEFYGPYYQLNYPRQGPYDSLTCMFTADEHLAAYIAALSPDVVLALLDELEALRPPTPGGEGQHEQETP